MTKVIFRKCKGQKVDGKMLFKGDIIAFFPETYGDDGIGSILSYEHCGQHSNADILFYKLDTLKATKSEYKALYNELVSIGYDDIRVMQKMTYKR